MSGTIYQRNFMETVLWQAMSARLANDSRGHKPPPVFLNRIKRLLELDAASGANAFATIGPAGRGSVAGYSLFDIVCMYIALILLNEGFKQSDAHFLMRHIKDELRQHYDRIVTHPPDLEQHLGKTDRPEFPSLPRTDGVVSDPSVFMLIAKVEFRECWSGENLPDPFIIGPTFCYGLDQLQIEMQSLGYKRPSRMVIEIAGIIVQTMRITGREELMRAFAKHSGTKRPEGKGGHSISVAALTKRPRPEE